MNSVQWTTTCPPKHFVSSQFSKRAVINVEDEFGQQMLDSVNQQSPGDLTSIGSNRDYDFELANAGVRIFGNMNCFWLAT